LNKSNKKKATWDNLIGKGRKNFILKYGLSWGIGMWLFSISNYYSDATTNMTLFLLKLSTNLIVFLIGGIIFGTLMFSFVKYISNRNKRVNKEIDENIK